MAVIVAPGALIEEPVTDDDSVFSETARVLLAALSAGAGAIHLALVMPHWSGSTVDGVTFALAGWFQLVLAFVLYTKPTRAALGVNIAANLVLIGVWALSRTRGLPWGAHAGTAEEVGTADLVCVAFEAALVLASALFLWRPGLGAARGSISRAVALALPVLAVMVATTGALAAEATGGHGASTTPDHHGGGAEVAAGAEAADHHSTDCSGFVPGADHADMTDQEMVAYAELTAACGSAQPVSWDQRCDAPFNIASYWREAEVAGVNAAGEAVPGHHGTGTAGSQGMGEQEAARLVVDLAEMDDSGYEEWLTNLNPANRDPNAPDDTGAGGHMGPQTWTPLTDQSACQVLSEELDLAREVATRYPTVAEAKAAGYRMVAPYVPGIASHFMNFRYVDSSFDIEEPEMLLFDGNEDDAQVVGLSYYLLDPGEEQPTQGFSSDNDQYHRHIGLCMKNGVVIGDTGTTDEQCAALGGTKNDGTAGWMSHAWVVPGCESPWGVFSAANPVLDQALVQSSGEGQPCSGSAVVDRYDYTAGPPDETTE